MHDSDYTRRIIDFIITKEEITPFLKSAYVSGLNPAWEGMGKKIAAKYGVFNVDRVILLAKVRWYEARKDWRDFTRALIEQVNKYGVGSELVEFYLNNNAYKIFLHSNDPSELNDALSWSNRAIHLNKKANANIMDTNANLLYKLGKVSEAILMETKAFELAPNDSIIKSDLEKMKSGEPTWPAF
jgi:tetratricopeptide (TPR) repeat protein